MGIIASILDDGTSRLTALVRREASQARPLEAVAAARPPVALAPDTLTLGARAARHADGQLLASDGQTIAYRTTEALGDRQAVVVMQQGTLGKPAYFDAMGEAFAQKGIKSYAVGSRTVAPSFRQHGDDLEAVVRRARAENPGAPITVMGVSLGAMITLDWSARHNAEHLPVVAMAPVVLNRFLGVGETLDVARGLFSKSARKTLVNTPMSAGVPLTTNRASAEFALANTSAMKVPAGLFDDVMKMTGDVALKGRTMKGPLLIAMGESDQVAVNGATRAYSHLIGSQAMTVRSFPGVAHDMSQETNHPELVSALQDFVLAPR